MEQFTMKQGKNLTFEEYVKYELRYRNASIDELASLSTHAYNTLSFSDHEDLSEIIFMDQEALKKLVPMENPCAKEIADACKAYLDQSHFCEEYEEMQNKKQIQEKERLVSKSGKDLKNDSPVNPQTEVLRKKQENTSVVNTSAIGLVRNSLSPQAIHRYCSAHDIPTVDFGLSNRSRNCLMREKLEKLSDFIMLPEEQFLRIRGMGVGSVNEILQKIDEYLEKHRSEIENGSWEDSIQNVPEPVLTAYDFLKDPHHKEKVLEFVRENDVLIEQMGLSKRPYNALKNAELVLLSEFIGNIKMVEGLPSLGNKSFLEIGDFIQSYLNENNERIVAYCNGDTAVLWDDEKILSEILHLYNDRPFYGFSLDEFTRSLQLPDHITVERLKKLIGRLLGEGKLEYIDYRCYRVYPKFFDALTESTALGEKEKKMIREKIKPSTLQQIGDDFGITRERVRQIIKKSVDHLRNDVLHKNGTNIFDEDYYAYLYKNYAIPNVEIASWLGMSADNYHFLKDLTDASCGKRKLEEALDDPKIDIPLKIKIRNYLNRNKIYIDGIYLDKKIGTIENYVIRKFCKDDISFDDFVNLYNSFLDNQEEEIDEKLYITEKNRRTREAHLPEEKYVLWKTYRKFRYYDTEGRDFSQLWETINMDSYENIEISTQKLMNLYPEIMKEYDIRDKYELHNLMRKTIKEGSYHDFHLGRMPELKFGKFHRESALFDLLIENAPISVNKFSKLVEEEFGYDASTVSLNYLKPFSQYCLNNMYYIDAKDVPSDRKPALKEQLKEDFYFIEEIRKIYHDLYPDADIQEINPYSLQTMDFGVYSTYAIQNYKSARQYFIHLLTDKDITDLREYKRKFCYIMAYHQALSELKQNKEIMEFEPDRIIHIRRLESQGISKEDLQDFCDSVYDYVDDSCFSIKSLRENGFSHYLYDLGFSDWFYAGLIASDERFAGTSVFGARILKKGNEPVTIRNFITELVKDEKSIDLIDLYDMMKDKYGCLVKEKYEITEKIKDSEIFYDSYLDRLYASEDLYFDELEHTGGF